MLIVFCLGVLCPTSYTTGYMAINPTGTQYLDPEALLRLAGIRPRMVVADLGAGAGFFTFAAARLVTEDGAVYVIDIVKSILQHLMVEAEHRAYHNIHPVWSNLEIVGAAREVADGSADLTLLDNVLYESSKRPEMIQEAVRMMKAGGRLLVIDWIPGLDTPFGPAQDKRVQPEMVVETCKTLGVPLVKDFRAGQFHFGLLFEKPGIGA